MKKLISLFFAYLSLKFIFKKKPHLKRLLNIIFFSIIGIFLIIYFHSEFIDWAKISNKNEYVSYSFIFKNFLILIIILFVLINLKAPKVKDDGFDRFRDKEKLQSKDSIDLKNYKPIPSNRTEEEVIEYFRNKKKLRSKAEIDLSKHK